MIPMLDENKKKKLEELYENYDPAALKRIGREFVKDNAATTARRAVDYTRFVVWSVIGGIVLFFVISIGYIFSCAKESGESFSKLRDETIQELLDIQ